MPKSENWNGRNDIGDGIERENYTFKGWETAK